MNQQNTSDREKLENIWIRLVYMILFFVTHRLASWILMVIAVIQFCLTLFSGNKNGRLNEFSGSLNRYIYQAGIFLSFESEEKPYPFDEWPSKSVVDDIAPETNTEQPEVVSNEKPVPKRTRKKAPAKSAIKKKVVPKSVKPAKSAEETPVKSEEEPKDNDKDIS